MLIKRTFVEPACDVHLENTDVPAAPGRRPPQSARHTDDDGLREHDGTLREAAVRWSFGLGKLPTVAAIKTTGAEVERRMLPNLQPGDLILSGTSGKVSHASVYVGSAKMIHSLATEYTQRSALERVWDTVKLPFEALGRFFGTRPRRTGVIEEPVGTFFDRFYRDTWVIMRPKIRCGAKLRHLDGVAKLRSLIGKPYDFDFVGDNDAYYCTELARHFYWASMGDDAPRVGARAIDKPFLTRKAVVDPEDFFDSPDFIPVAWNRLARGIVKEKLAGTLMTG